MYEHDYAAAQAEAERQRRMRARERERRKRRQRMIRRLIAALLIIVVLIVAVVLCIKIFKPHEDPKVSLLGNTELPSWVDKQILPESADSRRGIKLEEINAIVIHYVGNPGTTAQQNRDFFGNDGTAVNSHFLVGLDGEIIQCIPLDEKSSATSDRNRDTISIEVCHPDETGKFNDITYDSLVKLTAWLCDTCGFKKTEKCVIRHYDATGKLCPLYYVENEDAWTQLLDDIDAAREK